LLLSGRPRSWASTHQTDSWSNNPSSTSTSLSNILSSSSAVKQSVPAPNCWCQTRSLASSHILLHASCDRFNVIAIDSHFHNWLDLHVICCTRPHSVSVSLSFGLQVGTAALLCPAFAAAFCLNFLFSFLFCTRTHSSSGSSSPAPGPAPAPAPALHRVVL
ncbi:hypothetical protein B484DRAFT_458557, partial [Ochromonadaceae sp. CCMP2298]